MRVLLGPFVIAAIVATSAGAQSPPPLPKTPGDCYKAILDLGFNERRKIQDTTLSPRYTEEQMKKVVGDFTNGCVAQFDPNTVDDSELLNLSKLYNQVQGDSTVVAQMKAKSRQAIERAVNNTSVEPAQRIERLNVAIALYVRNEKTHSLAEQRLADLDQVPTVTPADRIRARQSMLLMYSEGNPQKTLETAMTIEALTEGLDSAGRASLRSRLDMTETKADAYVEMGQINLAKQLYETKIASLTDPKDSSALRAAKKNLKRYQLFGSKAERIVAQHWLNSAPGTQQYDPEGKVSLIMMTAHWCGPCKASYPAIARISKEYAPKGVETVVVTKTFGYFGSQKDLSPLDEVEADRKFYVDEYNFTMPMAIYATEARKDSSSARIPNPNEEAYVLAGYPTYIVIGRDGIIRDMMIGWGGKRSEERLAAALEKALRESNAS